MSLMDPQTNLKTSEPIQSHPAKKPLLTLIVATLLVASGLMVGYLIGRSASTKSEVVVIPTPTEAVVACTLDAKLCPDGSSVGRVGPNCEFAPCSNITNVPLNITWTSRLIDLYKIGLDLPEGWTIKEVNRRPEPTGPTDPKRGHDCAEYELTDEQKQGVLYIQPLCGYGDGGASEWPDNTVIIKEVNNLRAIIRFFDTNSSSYIYSIGYKPEAANVKGTTAHILSLNFDQSENSLVTFVSVKYVGPKNKETEYLTVTDKIVSSLQRQ